MSKFILSVIILAFFIIPIHVSAQEITASHSPADVSAGDTVTINVKNPDQKGLKIFVDSTLPIQCVSTDCSASIPNVAEGIHVYYVSVNDETTLGPFFFLAKDKTCTSSSITIDPVYRISNTKEDYKITIKNNVGEDDSFNLEYIPPVVSRYSGAFSSNKIDIDKGQTKDVTLSITPSLDVPNLSKFKVKVTTQLTKQTAEACGYFFVGHSVKISTTSGGTSNPSPSFFNLKLPNDISITIHAKPLATYDFEKWVINSLTSTGSSETFRITKDYTISLSFTPKKTTFCTDPITFTLTPSTVKPSSQTIKYFSTANIDGLKNTNCQGKTVSITSGNTAICSCTGDANGQCSCTFEPPGTMGSYIYEAKIDRNNDGDYDDTSSGPEKLTNTLSVSSSASPLCTLKVSKSSNFRYVDNLNYKIDASLFNLPETLNKIKLKCDIQPETVVDISGPDYSPPVKQLSCDFNSLTTPGVLDVSVSSAGLPECKAKIEDFFPPQLKEINLNKGWNLISPAYDKYESTNCQLTATIWKYTPSTNKYDAVESLQKIEPGIGYWVKVADKCTVRLSGTSDKQITFMPGSTPGTTRWNMISSGQEIPVTRNELEEKLKITTCSIVGKIWVFNTEANMYKEADTLIPGYGYWMKIKSTTESGCGIQL